MEKRFDFDLLNEDANEGSRSTFFDKDGFPKFGLITAYIKGVLDKALVIAYQGCSQVSFQAPRADGTIATTSRTLAPLEDFGIPDLPEWTREAEGSVYVVSGFFSPVRISVHGSQQPRLARGMYNPDRDLDILVYTTGYSLGEPQPWAGGIRPRKGGYSYQVFTRMLGNLLSFELSPEYRVSKADARLAAESWLYGNKIDVMLKPRGEELPQYVIYQKELEPFSVAVDVDRTMAEKAEPVLLTPSSA